jgi:hypothetical protein
MQPSVTRQPHHECANQHKSRKQKTPKGFEIPMAKRESIFAHCEAQRGLVSDRPTLLRYMNAADVDTAVQALAGLAAQNRNGSRSSFGH